MKTSSSATSITEMCVLMPRGTSMLKTWRAIGRGASTRKPYSTARNAYTASVPMIVTMSAPINQSSAN